MKAEEALIHLGALATGLCRDAGIGVELTERTWAFDPARRVILMSRETLSTRGADYCAGIVAHEVGHYFVSRYLLFDVEFPSARCRGYALNAIEDARCETWIMRRYPGASAWLAEVGRDTASRPLPDGLPSFLSFALECARERDRGWRPPPASLGTTSDVDEALTATREARRRYAELLPPSNGDVGSEAGFQAEGAEAARRYAEHVRPRLSGLPGTRAPDTWECVVRTSSLQALDLAVRDILPTAAALLRADVDAIASALDAHPALERAARQALDGAGGGAQPIELTRAAMTRGAERRPAKPAHAALALRLIEATLASERPKGLAENLGRHGAAHVMRPDMPPCAAPPPPAAWAPAAPLPAGPYDQVLQQVQDQIDRLVAHLEEVLVPRQRLREREGHPSGHRVDLRRLMQFEADPRRAGELWRRKTIPDRRRACFSLLVDLSGSMEGGKADAAFAGTVLLCETLTKLGVSFAVDGFQDRLIPFVGFDDCDITVVRHRLPGMVLETTGSRAGGHNQPGNNDDGPCLIAAASALAEQAASDKLLIVISDGEPNGLRSGPDELRRAVAQIETAGEVELVAIGLGPGTEHVRRYYPKSVANVPGTELSAEIGRLIEGALAP